MLLIRRAAAVVSTCFLLASCIALPLPQSATTATAPMTTLELPPASLPNGVAAGDVTQDSVVLWARAASPGIVTFTMELDSGAMVKTPVNAPLFEPVTRTVSEPLLPVTVTVAGLTPATAYRYQATVTNSDSATGVFRTAAGDGEHIGLRFAATGDVRGDLAPYPSIVNTPSRNLDFFVNLGDTIYADFLSPAVPKQAQTIEEFRLKQDEVNSSHRDLNTLAALRASTISFATIDDHEVLNNFSGGAPASSSRYFAENTGLINEARLYRVGVDAFLAYQPTRVERYGADADVRMVGRPKIYRYRTFGADAALYVLDMRSFRDEPLPKVTDLDDDETIARFEQASFAADRTVLGTTQMADLQHDLLDAQQRGITWKFVVVPDPIQLLDMTSAPDRWQGYAAERTTLLRFIDEQEITNVVFIAADIHGTVVNNLTYQAEAGGPQIPVNAWEIAVGPVAAYEPFGIAMYLTYVELGLLTEEEQALYESLPLQYDTDDEPDDRDDYVKGLVNEQMARFGHNPIGLADAPAGEVGIEAELLQGDYMAGHVYGWTEFEVDANSQALTVTTYGVPAYVAAQMERDAQAILMRAPEVVSQFVVQAK